MTRRHLFSQSRPSKLVPTSPVQRSSRLRTHVFNSHQRSASHRLDSSPTLHPPLDMSRICVPKNPDFIPPTRLSKFVRRSSNAHLAKQRQMVASAEAMHDIVLKLTMIPQPGFGCIITLQFKSEPQPSIYQMTMSSLPKCNCTYFLDMIFKFDRKRNSYMNCKHLYYIFIKVSNLDAEVNLFIHALTFSFN